MSSLHIINRSTKSHGGGGLPFYNSNSYIFSSYSNEFNSNIGLWSVPPDKVPTFQIFVPGLYTQVTTFQYLRTEGNNVFTGTFSPPIGAVNYTGVQVNGISKSVFQTSDAGTLITPAPVGRYVINLVLSDGGTNYLELWSEEFLTKDCC
tara:strand:- start:3480 stop:3926 length:447 start_codon:yes stop_codon:yes gene_type:complete